MPIMKFKGPKHRSRTTDSSAVAAQWCEAIDRSIPGLRTVLIIGGLLAAAAQAGKAADFLFATGLLFHLALSFELWWMKKRTR
jgi:hypothetical protein